MNKGQGRSSCSSAAPGIAVPQRKFKRSGSKSNLKTKLRCLPKRRGRPKLRGPDSEADLPECKPVNLVERLNSADNQDEGLSVVSEDKYFSCRSNFDEVKVSSSPNKSVDETSESYSCYCCCNCSPLEKGSGRSQNDRTLNMPNRPCACTLAYHSSRIQLLKESRRNFSADSELDIQASKSTWTKYHTVEQEEHQEDDHKLVREENVKAFEELKSHHPEFSQFFSRQEYKLKIDEEMIGEGGQAEIYGATGWLPKEMKRAEQKLGFIPTEKREKEQEKLKKSFEQKLVVKVFKNGFRLSELLKTWTPSWIKEAFLDRYVKNNGKTGGSFNLCWAVGAQLLNGRFAFVFPRHDCDLRKLIDQRMMLRDQSTKPPFEPDHIVSILLKIAKAMVWLHGLGFIHKDLKAANILCNRKEGLLVDELYIADFESSVGIVGTGFWRAPEILKALKERKGIAEAEKLITQEVDVYSFAMTGYEVITGLIPLEGHKLDDYGYVIDGRRPPLDDGFCSELNKLIRRCWHHEPLKRPSFYEIVHLLEEMI